MDNKFFDNFDETFSATTRCAIILVWASSDCLFLGQMKIGLRRPHFDRNKKYSSDLKDLFQSTWHQPTMKSIFGNSLPHMINFIVCDYVESNLWMYLIQARKQDIHTYQMMKRKKQNKQQQKKNFCTYL